ncbi:MAG: glycosyltransferase [Bacteroidia bacterium]|nr:glycosyltransferase [Bacteroidia bacterium]
MKILVILPRVPYPLEKGDKLRAFNQIKYLSKNHLVHLYAINDTKLHKDAIRVLGSFCYSVTLFNISKISIIINVIKAYFTGKPLQVGYFYNKKAHRQILEVIEKNKPDHIYCQLVRVAEYVKDLKIPKTLDYQDAFSKGVERRITNAPFYKKLIFQIEFKRLQKYEQYIFPYFDNKTIISEQDREHIQHPEKNNISIITNGVDTDYFKPFDAKKIYDLVFTGNMNYPPNIDGAEFLAKNVLPLLLKKYPFIKLLIAGASPSARVLALKSENVIVSGWVDDMRKCYAESRIFIAPMHLGIGLQNKLLEAMAMQIPCITSDLANNALKAEDNKEILIGKNPEDYVRHISYLTENPEKAQELAMNGYAFVIKKYNWDINNSVLEQIIIHTPKHTNNH